ncbi:MAG: ATP-binding cassette domain-containing protein [Ruthenibacterium lactatiformans]
MEGVSFSIQPGQTLGIIGGTGCGKTTLVRLLTRDYDVTGGAVRVDGTDVREYTSRRLHAKIGLVPQAAQLFSGTVRSNLQLGAENAPDTLWKALEVARAPILYAASPTAGYSAEEGGKTSPAARSSLTIARALAKQPDILVLDDSPRL